MIPLLVTFLLLFPKGGCKIGSVPITWGYLLLGVAALFSLFRGRLLLTKAHLLALCALIPFQIISSIALLTYGSNNLPETIAFITSFFILPLFFFLLFTKSLQSEVLFTHIRRGIFFIAAYGIFLFFFKLVVGTFIEIPFLTVNYHDMGMLESKCIDRGRFFKLISTYNNGNLYGICMLMLLPLYNYLETSRFRKTVVALSLLLTLSRTVWIGMLFVLLFSVKKRYALLAILCLIPLFSLFDAAPFGEREHQLAMLLTPNLFAKGPYEVITEVTYAGVANTFGLFGLLAFILAMSAPLFLFWINGHKKSAREKAIALGLLTYLLVSFSDGAMLYIPTLVFYWTLCSLLLIRRPLDRIGHFAQKVASPH